MEVGSEAYRDFTRQNWYDLQHELTRQLLGQRSHE
jgi:hypothetical protein